MREIRTMSPGKLGHGCNPEEIARGLAMNPHFVAVDAGSTDIGAYYLGSGLPFYDPVNILKDLEPLVLGALGRGIPLIIGNVVGTGTNRQLDTGLALLKDVASKHNLGVTVALVRAEQDKAYLRRRLREQPIEPLGAKEPLTEGHIDRAAAIVAQMGVEPLIKALDTGAQIVLAGRACDDALFAAIPVREGYDRGLALHMGKIVECGSMSCVPGDLHGSLFARLREDHFILEPPLPTRRCTVHSVASHTLYERSNPYLQPGPGGVNDLRDSRFEQVDERAVKVSGSRWITDPVYKLRLEGARLAGHRSISITGIRDPILIGCLDGVLAEAEQLARTRFDAAQGGFEIVFRQYGRNGVMGALEPEKAHVPIEIGLLLEVIADTQELADAVCMYVRGTVQHAYYPGILATAGNMAYPFSPFTVPAGPMYRFHIDHLLPVADPLECFAIEVVELR
jgi:hypothetical protein